MGTFNENALSNTGIVPVCVCGLEKGEIERIPEESVEIQFEKKTK